MDKQLFGKGLKMLVNRGHFEMKMLFFDIHINLDVGFCGDFQPCTWRRVKSP